MKLTYVIIVAAALLASAQIVGYLLKTNNEKVLSPVNAPQNLDADPNLKLVSEHSPYMRTER